MTLRSFLLCGSYDDVMVKRILFGRGWIIHLLGTIGVVGCWFFVVVDGWSQFGASDEFVNFFLMDEKKEQLHMNVST